MAKQTSEGLLGLGDNQPEMVGLTAAIPGAGGGECHSCHNVVATLLPGHVCARCSQGKGTLGDSSTDEKLRRPPVTTRR